MAKKKSDIKINKNHEGKEFNNFFRFVGKVKPVMKKDDATDSWVEAAISELTQTKTGKDRKVVQFIVETAHRNELKVELAGMEQAFVYPYSSKHKKSFKLEWEHRFDKTKFPDESYKVISTDWDLCDELATFIKPDMWVDVRGVYEFSSFENNEGETINVVKRIIKQVYPLKNGLVEINNVNSGEEYRIYDSEEKGRVLGYGKAKEETVKINVGWLSPEGGNIFITKLSNGEEGKRVKVAYNENTSETDRIKVVNNVESTIRINKEDGSYEYIPYIRDFKSENFIEINEFEMQMGIKSVYQEEGSKDTKVNAAFLGYGKERSQVYDVELTVYHKEPEEGKRSIAEAFANLNRLDFLVVHGIDNNRAEFATVEVEEQEEDNPFADVDEKVKSYEQVSTGTKKGLEILNVFTGTYAKNLLTEEEITGESEQQDPFSNVSVSDDELPF
ncbi:hypothetical protein B4127_1497 [Bacillus pumilus]|uniref:Phage portal protein n=1 Tax=Bacillus pumilus TaxID=1408 RepID=A0AB34QNV3_BACPU|nr:hypothetical protein [Bacillus pumilus]KIL12166.1 hypothetical protein B4127_1497 [Bacillus pumilus]